MVTITQWKSQRVVKVDADKAKDWISKGAQPTDTGKNSIQKTWCSVIIGRITHEGIIVNSCKKKKGLVEFPDQVTVEVDEPNEEG